jgi:hypothetical protein
VLSGRELTAEILSAAKDLWSAVEGPRDFIGSRTCKPNSVCLAAGRSFLWAAHYCAALATYPKVLRTEPARARRRCKISSQRARGEFSNFS